MSMRFFNPAAVAIARTRSLSGRVFSTASSMAARMRARSAGVIFFHASESNFTAMTLGPLHGVLSEFQSALQNLDHFNEIATIAVSPGFFVLTHGHIDRHGVHRVLPAGLLNFDLEAHIARGGGIKDRAFVGVVH